jgi:hypothetical protein
MVTVPVKPYRAVIVTVIEAVTPGPTFNDPGLVTIEKRGWGTVKAMRWM